MKINKINNVQFQKKLVGKAKVIKNNKPEKVNIYQLEEGVDKDYFLEAKRSKDWQNSNFLRDFELDFKTINDSDDDMFFSMEDAKGRILSLSEVINSYSCMILDYLETAPRFAIETKEKRAFKYIGETMIAFIASLCKKENKNLHVADIVENPNTRNFYFQNCGLEDMGYNLALLRKTDIGRFLEHNKNHTSSSVELIV